MNESPDLSPSGQAVAAGDAQSRPPLPGTSALNWKWSLLAGVAYGLSMRLLFGIKWFASGVDSGPMLGAFVMLVPFMLGMLAVYLQPPGARSLASSLIAPWLPLLVFVAGTAVLLIEGSICIVMALPIFLALASFGGLTAWLALKFFQPSRASMGGVLLLPLLAGAFERQLPPPPILRVADADIHIQASPEAVWKLINNARDVRPQEMSGGLAWRIGVPYPVEAVTMKTDQGRVRKLRWQGGVAFDEPILDWQENRYIRWRYVFDQSSFPPGTFDEHVLIGGKHFDLIDTSYRLTPEGDGTRLAIRVSYRISTRFNAYADAWGRWLVGNAADSILGFYKQRSERAGDARG
jgi:hypothetical protein